MLWLLEDENESLLAMPFTELGGSGDGAVTTCTLVRLGNATRPACTCPLSHSQRCWAAVAWWWLVCGWWLCISSDMWGSEREIAV